ncbi:uncharacterized protein TNCV_4647861 [Trichonephila clavipes]|uniref:Uncharacterized protein n=1 Tax=Trichonephila clavipes TaxID=2585209 RepID=A0A8X6VRT5_TRICX|nr:uncharacterized protein TNCV_4647861 [Trichonephila clavipes]
MSSSPVPPMTCRVGQRCTLNLSRAETSSRWCGVVIVCTSMKEGRFVLGTFRSKRMRILNRSRQNDRPHVMLVLVHIDITPPHTPLPVFRQISERTIPYSWRALPISSFRGLEAEDLSTGPLCAGGSKLDQVQFIPAPSGFSGSRAPGAHPKHPVLVPSHQQRNSFAMIDATTGMDSNSSTAALQPDPQKYIR